MQDSPFPPIADYGFLSDCHTGALVASDGSIEWMCLPHFDSPSVFGALLDRGAGSWRVGPYGLYVPAGRRYIPGTNMIETTWMTPQGWLRVIDALTIGDWHDNEHGSSHTRPPDGLRRRPPAGARSSSASRARCRSRSCASRCSTTAPCRRAGSVADRRGGRLRARRDRRVDAAFRLFSDMRMGIEGNRAHGRHTMVEGERRFCALSWTEARGGPHTVEQAEEHLERTSHFWRTWLAEGTYPDHPWRVHLQRSALVLKGLTFMPTGALVAAPTTSLPETPGGERNWDYRYCWMRDASFTLWGLHALGLDWEADDFVQYVADVERNEDGSLQIMYGIERREGPRGVDARAPQRLRGRAPGAHRQRRLQPAPERRVRRGARLGLPALQAARPHPRAPVAGARATRSECAAKVWQKPDQGIWEARGEPRHYVSSKLMCWVAMDRGARLAERRGDGELRRAAGRRSPTRSARTSSTRGVDERGVFRQHYDTDALDASNLLVPLLRFLGPDDERVRATVTAIRDELTEDGLVLRYRTEETDDGLHGEEGTFLICSFWLVSALSEIGEHREAEHLCERLLSYSSPLELYAEELEASSGRHLGNYPQAFTHLALINAVTHVIEAQQQT